MSLIRRQQLFKDADIHHQGKSESRPFLSGPSSLSPGRRAAVSPLEPDENCFYVPLVLWVSRT